MIEKEPVKVLIVSGSEKGAEYLLGIFSPPLFEPPCVANNAGEAKRRMAQTEYDIVVINAPLKDEFGTSFAADVANDTYSGVMMLIKSDIFDQVSCGLEELGIFTVSKPTNASLVYSASRLCLATRARLLRAEKKNESLLNKMEEIRLVNRAKWLLIQNLGVSEAEAHRLIEKQAMDMRQSKRDICVRLIRTYEN